MKIAENLYYNPCTNRISLCEEQESVEYSFRSTPVTSYELHCIEKFVIELTEQCNLSCTYCCYSGAYDNQRVHGTKAMSTVVLDKTIDFIYEHHNKNADLISVAFYGGEPLLAFEKMQHAISRLKKLFSERIEFSMTTNGILLTPRIIDWICSVDNFRVNVSLDGSKIMHDMHRVDCKGHGSYDRIKCNLEYFLTTFPNEFQNRVNFLSTIHDINVAHKLNDEWGNITFTGGKLPLRINFINPTVDTIDKIYFSDLYRFYKEAFDEFVHGNNNVLAKFFKKLIEDVENRDMSKMPDEAEQRTCLNEINTCFITAGGQLYPCEKCGTSLSVGDVSIGFDFGRLAEISKKFSFLSNTHCSSCFAIRLCQRCLLLTDISEEQLIKQCKREREYTKLAIKYYYKYKLWKIKHNG